MHRSDITQSYSELSNEELLERLNHAGEELHESMQKISEAFGELSAAMNAARKKALQDEYLQHHTMDYLQASDTIVAEFHILANDTFAAIRDKAPLPNIKDFQKKWNNAILISCEMKVKIKDSSQSKMDLTNDDIEEVTLTLNLDDLFGHFSSTASHDIDKQRVTLPKETPEEKMCRMLDAYNKSEQSFSARALRFFERHPYIATAGMVASSAAIGLAVGFAAKSMSSKK